MTHDPKWWAMAFVLSVLGWNGIGLALASWRQRNDDNFLIAMILWTSSPLWVWFLPFSRELRLVIVSFWRGMDWIPPAENEASD